MGANSAKFRIESGTKSTFSRNGETQNGVNTVATIPLSVYW